MITLGSANDLKPQNLWVYVMAVGNAHDPSLVSFVSVDFLADTEEEAYDLGHQATIVPEGHVFLNDYVHMVEV
jgi:hypothetical protein